MTCPPHKWSLTLEWDEINGEDALCPTAYCKKRGCKEKLGWREIESMINGYENIKAILLFAGVLAIPAIIVIVLAILPG